MRNRVIDLPALRSRIGTLAGTLGVVWGVSLFALYVDRGLVFDLALVPRRVDGLLGVFGMPLVHGSMEHLLANTAPLAILGGLVVARGAGYFLIVSLAIAVLGGLALWLFGREAAHVGASGLVFGFFGFLVTRAFYERSLRSALVALLVIVAYGTMFFGVLPQGGQISWEGHLFGLIAGGFVARGAFAVERRRTGDESGPPGGLSTQRSN